MLSNSVNFYLPKNNRCYENYVYLTNKSIRSFVLLAYPLLFLNLCIFCIYVPLSFARQNKESEKSLFNTNYERLQGWLSLIRTGKF